MCRSTVKYFTFQCRQCPMKRFFNICHPILQPPSLNTPNRGWSRWDGILQAAKSTRLLYPLVLTRAKVLQRQAGWSLFFPFGEHNTPLNKIYMEPKKSHHWKGKSSSRSPILRGQNVASKWLFVLPFFGRLNETQEQSINPLMALQQYQVGTSCRVGRVPYTFWKARLLFGCRQWSTYLSYPFQEQGWAVTTVSVWMFFLFSHLVLESCLWCLMYCTFFWWQVFVMPAEEC